MGDLLTINPCPGQLGRELKQAHIPVNLKPAAERLRIQEPVLLLARAHPAELVRANPAPVQGRSGDLNPILQDRLRDDAVVGHPRHEPPTPRLLRPECS